MNHRPSRFINIILDLIALLLAFFLAGFIRYHHIIWSFHMEAYRAALCIIILVYLCVYGYLGHNDQFLKRGYIGELLAIFRVQIIMIGIVLSLFFLLRMGQYFSRTFFMCFFSLSIVISLTLRIYYKVWLQAYYRKSIFSDKVLIITSDQWAEETVQRFRQESVGNYYITGVAILDRTRIGEEIRKIPVIADHSNLFDVVVKEVVDRVLICYPYERMKMLDEMILQFQNMGIIVELSIQTFPVKLKEKMVKEFAGFHVITFSTRIFQPESLVIKRLIDIIGSIFGLLITALVSILVVPAIFIESPGHVIFKQTRIGKNGRRFSIFKFRSMYPDAEKRKQELMSKNQMTGLMFKLEDDPRITKVGKFIRKTSLDEFPQFLNVLLGSMSLVGTRPPTEDEFLQYESRHKRRLALKPGITGLWQVSGRSSITDFEEVVKLDLEYIDHWSVGEDIRILLKTIVAVVLRIGAR